MVARFVLLALCALAVPAAAQDRPAAPPVVPPTVAPPTAELPAAELGPGTPPDASAPDDAQNRPPPDVEIDVERLSADSLGISADYVVLNLRLNAGVAELLHIDAGLEVRVDSLSAEAYGTAAAAQARLYLDVVTALLSEALQVVDEHPELAGAKPTPATTDD